MHNILYRVIEIYNTKNIFGQEKKDISIKFYINVVFYEFIISMKCAQYNMLYSSVFYNVGLVAARMRFVLSRCISIVSISEHISQQSIMPEIVNTNHGTAPGCNRSAGIVFGVWMPNTMAITSGRMNRRHCHQLVQISTCKFDTHAACTRKQLETYCMLLLLFVNQISCLIVIAPDFVSLRIIEFCIMSQFTCEQSAAN